MNQIQKSTEANRNTLTHEPILNKYIDLEIDRCDEILPKDRWADGCRSDIEIKQRCHNLAQDSVKRRNNDRAQESGVLQHAEIGLPVFDRASAQKVIKFLQDFVLLHGIPHAIILDHAKSKQSADQMIL